MITIDSLMVPSHTSYDLTFSHNTARLALHIGLSRLSKVNDFYPIWQEVCDFLL